MTHSNFWLKIVLGNRSFISFKVENITLKKHIRMKMVAMLLTFFLNYCLFLEYLYYFSDDECQ